MIKIKEVFFDYDKENVFANLSLQIIQGDFVILVGPNGGGKTTLLKLAAGILKPNKGVVELQKENQDKAKVSYVSQSYNQGIKEFPATVEEIVSLGLIENKALKNQKSKEHVVRHVLQLVKIEDLQKKQISELSGGQQQRVMLARALVGNPQVLLLDEPTSGIDIVASEKIFALLALLNKNLKITIIMVSHDINNAVKYASKIACVNRHLCYYGESAGFMEEHIINKHKWFYAKE